MPPQPPPPPSTPPTPVTPAAPPTPVSRRAIGDSRPRTGPESADTPSELSVAQLAHELNSLLDGSLRCLNLATHALRDHHDQGEAFALDNLASAHQAMRHMAEVLGRAMEHDNPTVLILGSDQPLAESVPAIVKVVEPVAALLDVRLSWRLGHAVYNVSTGPLESIIVNALRNGVEAVAGVNGPRHVRLEIEADAQDLVIRVCDSGPGFPADFRLSDDNGREGDDGGMPVTPRGESGFPGGHGIGLALCNRIARSLGGSMEIRGCAHSPAAKAAEMLGGVVEVRVPLGNLRR